MKTYYVMIDEQSLDNLSTMSREDYIAHNRGNQIVYAGSEAECSAFSSSYSFERPFLSPWM